MELFAAVDVPLSTVLCAHGCREGWLQGEAFRYFRERGLAFHANALSLPGPSGSRSQKADFAAYTSDSEGASLTFVAELKVYGEWGYYPKNLTGGSLDEIRRRLIDSPTITFTNCPSDRQLVVGSGLLNDYFRLADFKAPECSPNRMLILCVQKSDTPDEFGKVLRSIEFEKPGTMLRDSKAFWAKAWTVDDLSHPWHPS